MRYLTTSEIETLQIERPKFDSRILHELREHWHKQIKKIKYETPIPNRRSLHK
jgi:hypothetical protein